jgi:phenol 2-monooxygenase
MASKETIHARYLIACDGAHSWVRNQLDIQTDSVSEDSSWGVLDIVPITDFRLCYSPCYEGLN